MTATGHDPARRPNRGRGVARVAFLFGVTGRDTLSGTELRRMFADLGTAEDATRALLARMVRHGQLTSTPRGRTTDYALAGSFAEQFARIRDRRMNTPAPWPGHFHALLYTVPEKHRGYRENLRREAVLAGYGIAAPGVLISTRDGSELLADLVARRPSGTTVWTATLGLSVPDAAAAASVAWDLPGLAGIFRGHARRLSTTRVPNDPARAFARYVSVLTPVLTDLGRQPTLPAELLPPDWPGAEVGRAIGTAMQSFGPAMHDYLARTLD